MTDTSWPSDPDADTSIRELALRSGEVHNEVLRVVPELLRLSLDQLVERGERDLAALHGKGRLSAAELEQLIDLLRLVRSEASPKDKSDGVDAALDRIRTSNGHPYAVVIASIASASSREFLRRAEAAGPDAVAFKASTLAVVASDVVGGVVGVLVGDELCGVPCGVLGGAAGALGASLAAQELL
ncbi:hypothetical protein [Kitasatospora sp. NPDC005748]|uniref:hypothetical protein n=1 Tax=Kitasatospora sp. NPDC005748 TaxID=3157063 RepID=UPI00340835A8